MTKRGPATVRVIRVGIPGLMSLPKENHNMTNQQLREVFITYDAIMRNNDAVDAVANCDDGLYGAFGELIDTASERLGRRLTDEEHDMVEHAFHGYQVALRGSLVA